MMISNKIHDVCQSQQIHCLHAIESGSRAWGFASPDSDYDVRLIYHHELDWYFQIYQGKDTFEFIQNDFLDVPFDIGGWELRKALQLLYKSNAVILEWLNSPIIYQSNDVFLNEMRLIQQDFFDPKAVFYHYQGMAKTASEHLNLQGEMKLKKWFYVLRALFASVWTIERNSAPPVRMVEMFDLVSKVEQEQIVELIDLKTQKDESYRHQLSLELQQLTLSLWQRCEHPVFAEKQKGDIQQLNALFKKMVME